MLNIKPILLADVVAGKPYIELNPIAEVLRIVVFKGRPFKTSFEAFDEDTQKPVIKKFWRIRAKRERDSSPPLALAGYFLIY